MLILDNSSVHGLVKFNMKTKTNPLYTNLLKNPSSVKKITIENFLKSSENNTILFILGITLVIIVIILTLSKKKPITNNM